MLVVPHTEPELIISNDIIIVGSSACILSKKYGKRIDKFKEVVRFNRAPVEGYEPYVGSKTTLRITNNSSFDNVDLKDSGYTNQSKDFIKNLRNSHILYFAHDDVPFMRKNKNAHWTSQVYFFDYEKINKIKQNFSFKEEMRVTTGMGFTLLCISMGIKPTLVGFDTSKNSKLDLDRTHYWEERPPAGEYIPDGTRHSVIYEKKIFSTLEQLDLIEIYK